MTRITIGRDSELRFPDRYNLAPGRELLLERIEDGFALREIKRDARRAYIEVTALCNLDCAMCVRQVWRDTPGEMTWETFQAIIEGLYAFPDLRRITFGGYGEPLTHPRFPEMLALATGLEVGMTLTTNGLLLDETMAEKLLDAHLDTVVVSLDTVHLQAYEQAHLEGGMDQVLDNVRTLRELTRQRGQMNPRIGLEFVAMRSNLEWLSRLPELASDLGASFVLITNLLPHTLEMAEEVLYDRDEPLPTPIGWPVPGADWLLWGIAKLPRMKWGAWRRCRFIEERALVIGWDGGVSPCYALMHSYPYYIYGRHKEVSRYMLGDVREQPLADIWTSDDYVSFRSRVREMRFPSCVDCGMACTFAEDNEDCWGNAPSCADCLWAQDLVRCP
ncbi:MAG: tungsten cofactor oxidoreductase radical SAM maturase [Anaerolineales bacterium]|nr:MAG: tungsten cofactor oxidoreductase radical SAM maturase [Anaerolineales bacterium]